MKVVIINQARMTSTRLPAKVMKQVLGKPLLEYQIERLKRVKLADQIVVATPINDTDQPIIDLCDRLSITSYRGSEDDVLARYHGAAIKYQAEAIVRVTSDCPIIDPSIIDYAIRFYLENLPQYDYVANSSLTESNYPRGMDVEVFSMNVLNQAFLESITQMEREHVTPFIYTQPDRYQLGVFLYRSNQGHFRLTVDTDRDFELIKRIIEELYPQNHQFTLEDTLDLLYKHPDWHQINAGIKQNIYSFTKKRI
ncbi:MAG: cytidylyltransferase domain-containing protein [Pseudanabaena sp.]